MCYFPMLKGAKFWSTFHGDTSKNGEILQKSSAPYAEPRNQEYDDSIYLLISQNVSKQ